MVRKIQLVCAECGGDHVPLWPCPRKGRLVGVVKDAPPKGGAGGAAVVVEAVPVVKARAIGKTEGRARVVPGGVKKDKATWNAYMRERRGAERTGLSVEEYRRLKELDPGFRVGAGDQKEVTSGAEKEAGD